MLHTVHNREVGDACTKASPFRNFVKMGRQGSEPRVVGQCVRCFDKYLKPFEYTHRLHTGHTILYRIKHWDNDSLSDSALCRCLASGVVGKWRGCLLARGGRCRRKNPLYTFSSASKRLVCMWRRTGADTATTIRNIREFGLCGAQSRVPLTCKCHVHYDELVHFPQALQENECV